jgi:hypothetical protein
MARIVRLTERDLTRLVKKIIREEQKNVNADDDYYSIDEKSIFEPAYGYGGGYAYQTLRGTEVWLNNKAQTSWPAGDAVKTKKAAQKLIKALSGLDISGSGAKLAQEVANEWKTYGLIDQNEFLRQWYMLAAKQGEYFKLSGGNTFKWGSPWEELFDDNEQEIASQMIDHSIARVKTYCQPYADQQTKAARGVGAYSKNVICDLFVTNNLLGIWK